MDGVLSVAHLKLEEAGAAEYYGEWTVVQRRQRRVVPVSADQDTIRGFKRFRNGIRQCAFCRGVVGGGGRRCRVPGEAEGLQGLLQRPLGCWSLRAVRW